MLLTSLLWSASGQAGAEPAPQRARTGAPQAGASVPGQSTRPVASAVVNFEELARQDVSRVFSPSPSATRAVHSPVTPPDLDRPAPGAAGPPAAPETEPTAPTAPSPSPTANFAGLDDIPGVSTGFMYIPPDTDGAVGLSAILTGLNNNYRILTKANGETASTVGVTTFWSGTGGSGFFDPRTLYDPINNRWIVCILSDAGAAASSIEIGVSQTSDPSGLWWLWRFDADATDTLWADFPCIGFNKNWIAVNVNMFTNSGNSYTASKLLVVNYTQALAGTSPGATWFSSDFCASPAATYSAVENTLYVPGHWSSSVGTYYLHTITGTAASPVYTLGGLRSRGLTWTAPGGQILPQAAPLSGTSNCSPPCPLETQDAFIRSTPVVRGGSLYYSQTVGLPAGGTVTRTGVQWTVLDASGGAGTGTVLDGGRVEDPTATSSNGGKWYAYPHIAANQYGDIILGFSQFSSSQFPSAGYTIHGRTDSAGVMNDPVIYKAGEDYYNKSFGSGRNRWGDYSKAQVDPSDDTSLWVANEYSKARVGTADSPGSNTSRWGTWWAKVAFTSTEATMSSLAAERRPGGNLVLWRTGMEVRNLGFNVYRDDGSGMVKLNPTIIAGSALIAGPDTLLGAGYSYRWWDADAPAHSRYWVEDVSLDTVATRHGPVIASPVDSLDASDLPPAPAPASLESLAAGARDPGSTPSRSAVLPADSTASLARQAALAAGPALVILVRQEGLHRISQPLLLAAGLDPGTDPRFLHLYVDGREIPILVRGGDDGRLDPSDSIEFYGVGLDASSTDRRAYWLAKGPDPGLRLPVLRGPARSPAPSSFAASLEIRPRTLYIPALRNGDAENFFGPLVEASGLEQPIALPFLDAAGPGPVLLEIELQGITLVQHRVRAFLGSSYLGEIPFAGQDQGRACFPLPTAALAREIAAIRLLPQPGGLDTSALVAIRASYPRRFVAADQALRFTLSSAAQAALSGFASPSIRVFDVTNPDQAFELAPEIRPDASGFSLRVAAAGRGLRSLAAFSNDRALLPAAIFANRPSALRTPANQADMVIISHADFIPALEPLRAMRAYQGLHTLLVDVQDIYDEFSYGHKSPEAIRDFLRFAKSSWRTAPRYVLLAGDASFDPRNYLGKGSLDFLPARLVDTGNMETASDDWFVTFDPGSGPQMAIGRLPARSHAEAALMVAKIAAFESSSHPGGALLVADIGDSFDFEGAARSLRGLAPPSMPVDLILRGSSESSLLQKQLIDAINNGRRLVNYAGHGTVDAWRGSFLSSADARALTNGSSLPLVISVTCLNGYFLNPDTESLAEALLRAPRGGAAAVWSSTGAANAASQAEANVRLFDLIFNSYKAAGAPLTIGEAAAIAKSMVKDADVRRTYVLLGDPAMRIR